MSKGKVNIGLVGVANHGQTILRAIQGCESFALWSCFDINSEASANVARTTGCKQASGYDELINDNRLEAVALVTPNFLHLEQCIKALERGKHIFVEKPFALNVNEAKKINEVAKKSGRILQVGHNTRKREVFQKAKHIINSGELGEIVSVYANMSFDFGLTKNVPEWKKQKDKCPLLPMTQLGIHFIDVLKYLIGPIKSVSCVQRSVVLKDKEGKAVTDSVAATLTFANGIIGTIQSDYVSPYTYEIVIFGSKAKATCADSEILLERWSGGKIERMIVPATEKFDGESYFAEIAEFAECILTNNSPEVDGQVGLYNLAVVEAMLRSAETRQMIDIDDVLQDL